MRIIRRTFANLGKSTLLLGHAGENLVTKLEIDISKELVEFTTPVFELVLKTPAISEPYPVLIDVLDDSIVYSFTGSDLQESGYGELEALVCGPNGEVLKSATAKIRIDKSIISNSYPGPIQKVIDDIKKSIGEIAENSVIEVVDDFPEHPTENKVVYINGDGLYIYYGDDWAPITSDNVLSLNDVVDNLRTLSEEIDDIGELVETKYILTRYDMMLVPGIGKYYPVFDDSIIGFVTYNRDPNERLYCPEGTICIVWNLGIFYCHGSNFWTQLADTNSIGADYVLLKKFSVNAQGNLLFEGKPIASGDEEDDVTLLSLTEYDALSLRDDITGEGVLAGVPLIGTIDDVPIYVLDNVSYGFGLYEDENNPSTCDSVSVGEVVDDDTGLPVRFVRAFIGGTNYARWSRDCTVDGHDFSREQHRYDCAVVFRIYTDRAGSVRRVVRRSVRTAGQGRVRAAQPIAACQRFCCGDGYDHRAGERRAAFRRFAERRHAFILRRARRHDARFSVSPVDGCCVRHCARSALLAEYRTDPAA